MWRKLHSDRNPQHTLWREIRREFGGHFSATGTAVRSFLNRYPRSCYAGMVGALMMSLALSFTLFRHPQQSLPLKTKVVTPVTSGLAQVLHTTEKIRLTLALKHLVDSISAKKVLSTTDSVLLDSALTQLERLQQRP